MGRPVKLDTPRVLVVYADDAAVPGADHDVEVQTDNRDLIEWDFTRAKQRPPWPPFNEAMFLWLSFIAWHALTRTGKTTAKWDDWKADVIEVRNLDADPTDLVGSPTLPGPGPG